MFRSAALKKFLITSLAEINPQLSLASNTIDFYSHTFQAYLMPRVCYAYFDIVNDCSDKFKYWPEAVKMDYFLEQCWKVNYEEDAV